MEYYAPYGPLLPVPAARSLSSINPRRGIIPDYTNVERPVEHLRTFAETLFYPVFPASSFGQFKAGAISIVGLIGLCGLILGRRLWTRSLWIFRVVQRTTESRRTESIVIPNALLAFVLMAGIFGSVVVALDFMLIRFFQEESAVPWSLLAWILLPWMAVKHGVVWAAWGTLYARPTRLTSPSRDESSNRNSFLHRLLGNAVLLNTCCIGSPFVSDFVIIVPTIIATRQYNKSLASYLVWQKKWQDSTQLNHEMLVELQDIWYRLCSAGHYAGIGFVLWSIIALSVWVLYTWVGIRLLQTIREQIQTLELRAAPMSSIAQPAFIMAPAVGQPRPEAVEQWPCDGKESSDQARSPLDGKDGFPHIHNRPLEQVAAGARAPAFMDPEGQMPRLAHTDRSDAEGDGLGISTGEESSTPKARETFFPPVKPSKLVRKQVPSKQATRHSKARYLRTVYWNVMIQTISISAAVLVFLGASVFAAANLCAEYETNTIAYVYSRALLWVSWASVVFGLIILGAIAGRVYEPLLPKGEKRRAQRLGAHGKANAPGPQRPKEAHDRVKIRQGGMTSSHSTGQVQVQTSFFESETIQPAPPVSRPPRTRSKGTGARSNLSPAQRAAREARRSSTSTIDTEVHAFEECEDARGHAEARRSSEPRSLPISQFFTPVRRHDQTIELGDPEGWASNQSPSR